MDIRYVIEISEKSRNLTEVWKTLRNTVVSILSKLKVSFLSYWTGHTVLNGSENIREFCQFSPGNCKKIM